MLFARLCRKVFGLKDFLSDYQLTKSAKSQRISYIFEICDDVFIMIPEMSSRCRFYHFEEIKKSRCVEILRNIWMLKPELFDTEIKILIEKHGIRKKSNQKPKNDFIITKNSNVFTRCDQSIASFLLSTFVHVVSFDVDFFLLISPLHFCAFTQLSRLCHAFALVSCHVSISIHRITSYSCSILSEVSSRREWNKENF